MATTAKAGRRQERTLRITQTSKGKNWDEQKTEQGFSNAPERRSVEETFLLQQPKHSAA
jgi:hypothetical protein